MWLGELYEGLARDLTLAFRAHGQLGAGESLAFVSNDPPWPPGVDPGDYTLVGSSTVQFDRGLLGAWSGEVSTVTGGSDLSSFLGRLDAVVAEHEADREVWPESWSWGPPVGDWEYE